MSQNGMQKLFQKQIIPGLKSINLEVCIHCLAGKQHRVAFKTFPPSGRANVLDLVHTNIYSMDAMSLSDAHSYITFIDDHSRKVWAYALKTKDQALNYFKLFQASIESETSTGKKLKCDRLDNGDEYKGAFEDYCITQGIKFKKTKQKKLLSIMELQRE